MRTLRALVVDDERLARVGLRCELAALDSVEVTGECAGGTEAVQAIREASHDVILLDIHMPGVDGFDVVRQVGPDAMPPVIFVTAHDEHALRAFEVDAIDYVLKPVESDRLREALQRVRDRLSSTAPADGGSELRDLLARVERLEAEKGDPVDRLTVKKGGHISFVDTDDVRWIESAGNYVRLHTPEETYLVRRTMKSLERDLDPDHFLRVRRSAIVNMDHVRHLDPDEGNRYRIVLEDGTTLHSSRRCRSTVREYLQRHR